MRLLARAVADIVTNYRQKAFSSGRAFYPNIGLLPECVSTSVNRSPVRINIGAVAGNGFVCLFALHVQATSLKRVIDWAGGKHFQGGICRTSADDANFEELSQQKTNPS